MSAPGGTTARATPCIIVIGLMPAEEFARFLRDLRARYPESTLTAVVGSTDLQTVAGQSADECLLWTSLPGRALVEELRRRQPVLVAVAYNPEYVVTRTYWKALALTILARAKGALFCERGRLPERTSTLHVLGRPLTYLAAVYSAIARSLGRYLIRYLQLLLIFVVSLPLVFVLIGIVLVDLVNARPGRG